MHTGVCVQEWGEAGRCDCAPGCVKRQDAGGSAQSRSEAEAQEGA